MVLAQKIFFISFPENDTPAQRIADVIDVVQRMHSAENMNIQIRLVTTGALDESRWYLRWRF